MSKSRRTKKQARKKAEKNMTNESDTKQDATEDIASGEQTDVAEEQSPETESETADPLAAIRIERDELMDQLLRARAEFDNFRKRIARDSERTRQLATEKLMQDLLPVLDNFDLALKYKHEDHDSLVQGVEMVAQQLRDVTARHGLETIVAEGQTFDPNIHEAVAQVPSEDVPADGVVEEFQRGYRLGAQVLRPAKVTVSAGPPETASGNTDEG